jgi:aryl-alcohol dehydrogenase-like predicted oxidoreductase
MRVEGGQKRKSKANLDTASVLAACDASLRRLQTSYIDLYQVRT